MINSIGNEIKRLRKSKSITQKELSKGICTQANISMIEKGTLLPRIDTLYKLSLKLKIPLSHFYELLVIDNYEEISYLLNEIEMMIINHQYKELYNLTLRELKHYPDNIWYKSYIDWLHIYSKFKMDMVSYDIAINDIKYLINTVDSSILTQFNLLDRMNNSIAILYSINKKYESALLYYSKISSINKVDISSQISPEIFALRVKYNKIKTLYDMKNYKEAQILIDTSIKDSLKIENMSILGNLYYYQGLVLEKQNKSKEKISDAFSKAYFIFRLLNREVYIDIIQKEKDKYLKDIL